MIWQAKNSSSGSYTTMKTPNKYGISYEDLDKDSYRSCTTGALKRTIVGRKWFKLSFEYKVLSPSEVATIMNIINNDTLYVRAKDPAFGTNEFTVIQGYVSKCECEKLEGNIGYSLKFNFIQSKKGSWQ